MPEIQTITLSHRELIEVLIRSQDLHEGIWQMHIEFGLGGANVGMPGADQVFPAAVVTINKIGLTKVEKEGPLALDASKVNPGKPKKKP